ncbi:ABC transporter ATP-binding protein [Planctomycetales bacterium ZRK34]|nr:ABC transporter ATP-binding protein [Planctomycetales bacterium ZRK34]
MTQAQMTCMTEPDAASPRRALLKASDLCAGYDRRCIVQHVSCELSPGELLGVIGPNGCGKSTLLKTLSGNLMPTRGHVELDGRALSRWSRPERARRLAALPQHPDAPVGMTVRDLVQCGRAPHARWLQWRHHDDRFAIEQAIAECRLDALTDRPLAELSGGERQRAWIAMTLAQQSRVLLLDEPTSALDIGHQLDVMHLLHAQTRQNDMAIAVVMHDINMAIRFCDRLLVMHRGRLAGQCPIANTRTWSLLEDVFDVSVEQTAQAPTAPSGCAACCTNMLTFNRRQNKT